MGVQRAVCERETIAVSATIWISVEKLHHQIRLRILSCSRMREKHREHGVPGGRSLSGRMSRWLCKDYLKGTCNNSFCEKMAPSRMLVLQGPRVVVGLVKSARSHTVRVDEQPTKRSTTNNDKSAVAMLKKGKLARKRIRLRCLSRSNGATCEKRW